MARRGVLYGGLDDSVVEAFLGQLNDPNNPDRPLQAGELSWPGRAFGGMGPSLFYGRDGDGRWIPYDLDAADENLECNVRDRPWPWCWGDVIWGCAVWSLQLAYFRWELNNGGELFIGRPLGEPSDEHGLAVFTRSIAVAESTRSAVGVLDQRFWSRLPPEPGPLGARAQP